MNRQVFIAALAVGLVTAPRLPAQSDRVARIGVLSPQSGSSPGGARD